MSANSSEAQRRQLWYAAREPNIRLKGACQCPSHLLSNGNLKFSRCNWEVVSGRVADSVRTETYKIGIMLLRVQNYCALGEKFQDERSKQVELQCNTCIVVECGCG